MTALSWRPHSLINTSYLHPMNVRTYLHTLNPNELTPDMIGQVVDTQSQSPSPLHKIDKFRTHCVAGKAHENVCSQSSPAEVLWQTRSARAAREQVAKVPINKHVLQRVSVPAAFCHYRLKHFADRLSLISSCQDNATSSRVSSVSWGGEM